ncbi:MAG: CoA ester lyase [Halioglobus sp.]|nr:CoA ester lyase [Halioglobus sp.]
MPNRSYMFIPGDSEKKLGKSQDLGADALILDLEDAVAESNKAAARGLTRDYLITHRDSSGPELWVRVNPLDTDHARADLEAIMQGAADGIFLPKPGQGEDVQTLGRLLAELETANGIDVGSTAVVGIVESARCLLNIGTFVGASERLHGMAWGAEDMAADLGASTNVDGNGEYFFVHQMTRANTLLACAAGDLQPLDSVYLDFRDDDGLRAECIRARQEGFTAKMAIHPAQVRVINECFTPSPEEMEHARRVIQAFEDAGGAGTVGLDGKMLDKPHLKQAERVLRFARSD